MGDQRSGARLLLVGDSHGNAGFMAHACGVAAERGLQRLFQVGDFGIWPGPRGRSYLDAVSEAARIYKVRVDFLDGNHEDHDALDEWREDPRRRHVDGSVIVAEHVHWWPRGSVIELHGRRIGVCGGAVSVDRHRRTPGSTWWPQEVIDIDDVNHLIDNAGLEPLDVFLSHDSPHGLELPAWGSWPADAIRDAEAARRILTRAMVATRPRVVIHGHWHLRYRFSGNLGWGNTTVIGVGAEDDGALVVLNLRTLDIEPLARALPTLAELHEYFR